MIPSAPYSLSSVRLSVPLQPDFCFSWEKKTLEDSVSRAFLLSPSFLFLKARLSLLRLSPLNDRRPFPEAPTPELHSMTCLEFRLEPLFFFHAPFSSPLGFVGVPGQHRIAFSAPARCTFPTSVFFFSSLCRNGLPNLSNRDNVF